MLAGRFPTDAYVVRRGVGYLLSSQSLRPGAHKQRARLHITCTPRQLRDTRRAWIRQEHAVFTRLLSGLCDELTACADTQPLRVSQALWDQPASLENHFRALLVFETL